MRLSRVIKCPSAVRSHGLWFGALLLAAGLLSCSGCSSQSSAAPRASAAKGSDPVAMADALPANPPHARAAAPSTARARPASTAPAQTDDSDDSGQPPPIDWKRVAKTIGKPGVFDHDVYHITINRDDLVVSVEGMYLPSEAGIASNLYFWRCQCGKMVTRGRICVADYEIDDVVDALRSGGIRVTSISNMLTSERPRVMQVDFYGEGTGYSLADAIKAALDWTGPKRHG